MRDMYVVMARQSCQFMQAYAPCLLPTITSSTKTCHLAW